MSVLPKKVKKSVMTDTKAIIILETTCDCISDMFIHSVMVSDLSHKCFIRIAGYRL